MIMNRRDEIQNLNEAMREASNKRLYERYLAVRLHLEGHTFTEIGTLLNRAYQTISRYWTTYRENGLEGLELDHSPGKPVKLTDEQLDELANTVEKKQPADVGFEAHYTWTLQLIADWIEREFKQQYTQKGVSKLLQRLGFSYTKATYTLANASAEEQEEFCANTFPALKKQLLEGEIDHLLFEDEAMIRAYQALQYNWFRKGQQRKIITTGKHEGAKLFAAINYETGHITHREEEQCDVNAFLRFLGDILEEYPEGKIFMILDNSRIHHASQLKPFLDKHKRLHLVFLPKYSPKLNLTEGLWKWVRQDVINNVYFKKFYRIRLHVSKFMKRLNASPQKVIDRLLVRL
nr:IS630 family transposase [Paenibacillus elgii]